MDGTEIVIFDVPGIGRSQMSWRPRRFAGLARLTSRLLDRLGYPEVDVAGVSWGGALAQQFARQYPRRCRRLILAATSAGVVMIPGRPKALSKMITPQRYLQPNYMQRAAGDIYGGEVERDPGLIEEHSARIIAPRLLGYLYQLGAGVGWTSIHWLHRLRQPTLVLAGAEDPLVPAANARHPRPADPQQPAVHRARRRPPLHAAFGRQGRARHPGLPAGAGPTQHR